MDLAERGSRAASASGPYRNPDESRGKKMEQTHSLLDTHTDVLFEERLAREGIAPVTAGQPTLMQMNLGYRCNQACVHCHVQAGPLRREEMDAETADAALDFARTCGISEFDLTGGAPELNTNFRQLVERISADGGGIIDRCNLTILTEPGQEGRAEFLAAHGVHIHASLPCYTMENTDSVRGSGVFQRSISALKMLNTLGYGLPDSDLELTLVYNPGGVVLPGDQASLEADYRATLSGYGISFTRLIAIANVPSGRFLRSLIASESLESYMRMLAMSFNPDTIPSLMCRTTISVGWDGRLYDCDFNQSLGLEIGNGKPATVWDTSLDELLNRRVKCGNHCYACAAGHGSSCGGAIAG
jgi:radical SAM/Cys-rich protein